MKRIEDDVCKIATENHHRYTRKRGKQHTNIRERKKCVFGKLHALILRATLSNKPINKLYSPKIFHIIFIFCILSHYSPILSFYQAPFPCAYAVVASLTFSFSFPFFLILILFSQFTFSLSYSHSNSLYCQISVFFFSLLFSHCTIDVCVNVMCIIFFMFLFKSLPSLILIFPLSYRCQSLLHGRHSHSFVLFFFFHFLSSSPILHTQYYVPHIIVCHIPTHRTASSQIIIADDVWNDGMVPKKKKDEKYEWVSAKTKERINRLSEREQERFVHSFGRSFACSISGVSFEPCISNAIEPKPGDKRQKSSSSILNSDNR